MFVLVPGHCLSFTLLFTGVHQFLFAEVFLYQARGYKSFFMLNSTENEFLPAYKCEKAF